MGRTEAEWVLTPEQAAAIRELASAWTEALIDDVQRLRAERDDFDKAFNDAMLSLKVMEHKVIACGVAADNPDPKLTLDRTKYPEKWESPQLERVRKLRAERDLLAAEVRAWRAQRARAALHTSSESEDWRAMEQIRKTLADARAAVDAAGCLTREGESGASRRVRQT